MIDEFKSLQSLLGRRLNPACGRTPVMSASRGMRYILTRPDFYSGSTHINMYVWLDGDDRVADLDGDKCYSRSTGLYSRSASVRDGHFTRRDVAYLRDFILSITVDP